MAGEVCDGLHVHPFHTAKYLREFMHSAVNEGLLASGRSRQDFQYAASVFVIVGDNERERADNAEAVRQQIAFYASTRTYKPVLAACGWDAIAPELHEKSLAGDWEGMREVISDEMLGEIAVSGTYDSIGAKLRDRYGDLLDRVSLYQPYRILAEDSRPADVFRRVSSASDRSIKSRS